MEDLNYIIIEQYNDSNSIFKTLFNEEAKAIDYFLNTSSNNKKIYKLKEMLLEQKLIEKGE